MPTEFLFWGFGRHLRGISLEVSGPLSRPNAGGPLAHQARADSFYTAWTNPFMPGTLFLYKLMNFFCLEVGLAS